MTGTEGTWIDWQCLLDAAGLLARCRYTLQYTYPYAYYMDAGPRKELVCVSTNCNSLCDLTGFWFLFSVWVPAGSVGGWNRKLVLESGTGRNNRPRGPWHSNGRLWETPDHTITRFSRVVKSFRERKLVNIGILFTRTPVSYSRRIFWFFSPVALLTNRNPEIDVSVVKFHYFRLVHLFFISSSTFLFSVFYYYEISFSCRFVFL